MDGDSFMELVYRVVGQVIHRLTKTCLANQGQEYLSLRLTFDEEWDDYTKYIIFSYHNKHYQFQLQYDDEQLAYIVIVPKEVLGGKGFLFTVYGEDDTERITAKQQKINLLESGYTTDISSIDYPDTTDVFNVIFGRLDNIDQQLALKMELQDVEYEIKKAYWKLENDIRTYGGN